MKTTCNVKHPTTNIQCAAIGRWMLNVGCWFFPLCLLFFTIGCTTKSAARRQAEAAFRAGQQQAIQVQEQPDGKKIQIIGNVKNSSIDWEEGISVSQAIVAADYQDTRDPLEIFIFRHGQVIQVNPRDLLRGRDQLLEPGDRIQLRR